MKRCKSYHRSNFAFPLRTSAEAASVGASRAGCAQGVALALSRSNVQNRSRRRRGTARPARCGTCGETLLHAARTDAQDRLRESGRCATGHRPPSHRGETRDTSMPTLSAVHSRRRGRGEWHQPVPSALRVASFSGDTALELDGSGPAGASAN